MEIRKFSTNIPVFSHPAGDRGTEKAQNRQKTPETDKVTIMRGNDNSPLDAGETTESKLMAATGNIKDSEDALTIAKQAESGNSENDKEQTHALPDTKGKAYFAVDDKKNVVIKVEDSKGNVVRQIPPEDYIKMSETLRELTNNLFHTTA